METLERHLGYWMRRVSSHISGEFARALQTRQASVAEWVVLRHLDERSGVTPGELATALALTRGAVSKIVDKLEAKGWASQTAKQGDSRVQLLSLTRTGRRALPHLAEIADHNDARFFDCLNKEEKATLRKLLYKLAEVHEMRKVPME